MPYPHSNATRIFSLTEVHPTQCTVGQRLVDARRQRWTKKHGAKTSEWIQVNYALLVVLGPGQRPYLIDNHHLGKAMQDEGATTAIGSIVADISRLDDVAFWLFMDKNNWMHPFDNQGTRCGYSQIPTSLHDLVDDPFRSLAGELRNAGGFSKVRTPYSEFQWADALRRLMTLKVLEDDFGLALARSMHFAHSTSADYLPGWCGPSTRD